MWVVSEDEPARPAREPVFQYEVLVGMMDLLAKGERSWMGLYDDLGVRPLEVVYEDLTAADGFEPTVRRVLRHLDLDDSIEIPARGRGDRRMASPMSGWIDSVTVT